MSRNLTISTQKKWSPSPDMAIREEDGEDANSQHLIEEEDESEEEEEEEEEGSDFTSSPSIPDENINFDLVYTLHTFEATVDGQASVKKGDALTLLDDSNSYWWLIRDLKTSEVGYIPAENIETPFERLARLNKHRNVELTSLEQAVHYINQSTKKPMSHKKVVLSTSLDVQLQVLLTGENEEDIQDETYETWQEEMLDDEEHHEPSIKEPEPPIDNNNEPADPVQESRDIPLDSKVLRVYAGNVDVGASYYSVRVTEKTSVDELLTHALEKFHISQIETQQGRHVGKHSCVEYYLTVKAHDGDEFILDPQDKPYAIHESLTAHLTTPMPSLTQFRQLASGNDYVKRKKKRTTDAPLQFFMHKRIKRVNDKSGQVHIKVSLMTMPPTEKTNTIKKMTTLRRFSKKKERRAERIDKLIATPASITISELTSIALVKFHLISDKDQPHTYRLILHANGKDTLLHAEQHLSDVLEALEGTEKYFVLHSFNSMQDKPAPSSTMKPTTTSSKVFPETIVHNRNHYLSRGHPVMTRLDSQTESILKRIDAALEAYEATTVQKKPNAFPSPMSVSRNKDGVDIHLPHGLLRSTTLADKKTQYSLMKFPNTLVLQKTVPGKNTDHSSNITGEDMATLVRYGSQYLDAYDAANKPLVTGRLLAEKDSSGKSLSSLEDLEKELQRIISSHSS